MRVMNVQLNLRFILPVLCLFILVACGGDSDSVEPEVATLTPAPTLTSEDRVGFITGSAENPLRLVLTPVQAVEGQVKMTLSEIADVDIESLSLDDSLRDDLDLPDDLAQISLSLAETFGVTFSVDQLEDIETVGDLVAYSHQLLSETLEADLFDRTSIAFEVHTGSRAESLQAVCSSGSGIVSIVWLDGIGYTVADADTCGQASLQVMTIGRDYDTPLVMLNEQSESEMTPEVTAEVTPDAVIEVDTTPEPENLSVGDERYSTNGLILLDRRLGALNIDVVRGRTFCRLGYDDYYSWLVPTLYMESVNIDPERDLEEIVDYTTYPELIEAVADGDCTATGISQAVYNNVMISDPELLEDVRIATSSIAFPYPILVYPVDLDLGVRLALDEVFVELGAEVNSALTWLLGHDAIVTFDPERLTEFRAFMASTGLDFAQLGD